MARIVNSGIELAKKILNVYGISPELVTNVSIDIPAYGLAIVHVDLIAIQDLEDIEYGDLKRGKVVIREKTIFRYGAEGEENWEECDKT